MDHLTTDNEPTSPSQQMLRRTLRHLCLAGAVLLGLLVLFLLSSGSVAADTPVSSDITTDTTWTAAASPIWVESSIAVRNGATLTIEPGVQVRFNGFYTLTVQDGALVAVGNPAGAGVITFTSNFTTPSPGAWNGIVFTSETLPTSVLEHVVVAYARTGVTLSGASVPIQDAEIRDIQWYGIRIDPTAAESYDLGFARLNVTNTGIYGIYVPSQTNTNWTLSVQDSVFANTGNYGILLSGFSGVTAYGQNFTLELGGNTFEDLSPAGVYLGSVSNFRNVTLQVADNVFGNTDGIVMTYGVYIASAPFYSVDTDDSRWTFEVTGNTVVDLDFAFVYFAAGATDGFRTVVLDISGNDVWNTRTFPYLDYGVYFRQIRFDDLTQPTALTLTARDNTVVDLDDFFLYFASTVSGFQGTTVVLEGNVFENTATAWMDTAVYFSSSPSYTTTHPGSFALEMSGNAFLNLSSYPLRLLSVTTFTAVTMDIQGNDFSGSLYGFFLSGGVDNAETVSFVFRDNVATGVTGYVLYATSFDGLGPTASYASFLVSGNTIQDSAYGLYLGDIRNYDASAGVRVEDNVLTDITYDAIALGLHDRSNSRIVIQSNTVTGPSARAISVYRIQDQTAQVDIVANTIEGAQRGIEVQYPARVRGETALSIRDNSVLDVSEYGIYAIEVREAAAFVEIRDNVIAAASDARFIAGLIYFDGGGGWFRSLTTVDIVGNVLDGGLHGIYFEGTTGLGATMLVDIRQMTVVGTGYGLTLNAPAGHAADIMNLRIRDSTFRDNPRGFLFLNTPGQGFLPIEIRGVQVTDYGAWGGYAFYMGSNGGAVIQIDVWSSTFQGAQGNLGSVYAGSGPVTMNFYFIPGLGQGVSNGANQLIRTLWSVDVQVLVGRNFDQPARFGVKVTAEDQFGVQSFAAVTDEDGMVREQLVSGYVITNDGGNPYSGLAVHTLRADWSQYNGTVAATFTSNGTATIYLPGDKDADGIPDHMDPDENPEVSIFLDPRIAPYALHIWVLLGLVGAVLIPLSLWILRGKPILTGEGKPKEETPKPPEQFGGP